jgi:hypothetical protein
MKNTTIEIIDKRLDSLNEGLVREHNLLVGLRSDIISSMGDKSINIDGQDYYLEDEVFDLMLKTSRERDFYRDIVNKLEQ